MTEVEKVAEGLSPFQRDSDEDVLVAFEAAKGWIGAAIDADDLRGIIRTILSAAPAPPTSQGIKYDDAAVDAVQRLLETGKATVDSDGYLQAYPTPAPPTAAREITLGDLYAGAPHAFSTNPFEQWQDTPCKVCGLLPFSAYAGEFCDGPPWMRSFNCGKRAGAMTAPPTAAGEPAGEVTQEDHGAAYDLAEAMDGRSAGECLATIIPKAFARHRTTAISTLQAEVERLKSDCRVWERVARSNEADSLLERARATAAEAEIVRLGKRTNDMAKETFRWRDKLLAAEAQVRELREASEPFLGLEASIMADIKTAHNRGNGATQWMCEDDREMRADLRKAFDTLRQALSPKEPSDDRS